LVFLWIISISILVACSKNNPNVNPEVYSAVYPDTLYRDAGPFYVEVSVKDPQGLGDIVSVEYRIDYQGGILIADWASLSDAGSGGDSVGGDGRYATLVPGFTSDDSTGEYEIEFRATDRDNNRSNTIKGSFWLSSNGLPVLSDPNIPDTIYTDSQDKYLFVISAVDPDGADQIDSVWFRIFRPDSSSNGFDYYMFDDGVNGGDSIAGDLRYSSEISASEFDEQLGNFRLEFYAEDNIGAVSEPLTEYVHLMPSDNAPPFFLDLTAPDTLSASSTDTAYIFLTVDDPQGLEDIDSVWFLSYRPDSTTSGTRYYLNDDGIEADTIAGDGIYSIGITSFGASPLGKWRFEFRARDIHGALSDSLDKFIYIIE